MDERIKFRPSFTATQIKHLVILCKENYSDNSEAILKILIPFLAKINAGYVQPAYVNIGKLNADINSISNNDDSKPPVFANDREESIWIHKKFAADLDKKLEVDTDDEQFFLTWRKDGELIDWNNQLLAVRYGFKRNLLTDDELIWSIKNQLLHQQEVIAKYPAKHELFYQLE